MSLRGPSEYTHEDLLERARKLAKEVETTLQLQTGTHPAELPRAWLLKWSLDLRLRTWLPHSASQHLQCLDPRSAVPPVSVIRKVVDTCAPGW